MSKKSYNEGFTLIEVVLAVALISTVIIIGINTYMFSDKTFKDAEKSTIIQGDMRYIAKYISDQLRSAYVIELVTGYKEPEKENNNIIYVDNGSIVHKYLDAGVVKTKFITDSSLGYKYNISYSKAKGKDGNVRQNVIEFKISTFDSDSTLVSSVIAQNMSEKDKIEGSGSSYIYYDSYLIKKENGDDPGGSDTSNCLTRSALAGTPMQPAVILLRDFRDSYMLTNMIGTKFASYYYKISPFISDLIANNETLKFLVRLLLIPFIFIAAIFTAQGGLTYALITILQIILVIVLYKQLKSRHKKFNAIQ